MIAVYGLGGATPDYDQFFQLWLNLPTVVAAGGFTQAVASVVGGGQPLPPDWIAAAVDNPAEASRWRRWDLRRTSAR